MLKGIHNQPGTAVCLCIKEMKNNVLIGILNANVAKKTINEYMCIVQNLKQQIVDEGSTKKEFPPCIPDSRFPLCIPNSRKLPVKVLQRAKNSVIGNARNLLHYLGQYDSVVASALTLAQSKSQNSNGALFKGLKEALQVAKYVVLSLPGGLSFEGLSAFIHQMKLPILVMLKNNHVIGICPYKVGDGSVTHYRIIDGVNSDLRCMEYSSGNLDWCCGEGKVFTTIMGGFAFVPGPRRSEQLLNGIYNQPGTAVCLCIKDPKFNVSVPIIIQNANVAEKTINEYMVIAKKLKQKIK